MELERNLHSERPAVPQVQSPSTHLGRSKSLSLPDYKLDPPEDDAVCTDCDGKGCELCDEGFVDKDTLRERYQKEYELEDFR